MATTNKQILLAARPTGFPQPTDFRLAEGPVPEPAAGEFLVGISYLSVDPYMRGRMNAARSYADPQKLDEVMGGGAVGKIRKIRNTLQQVARQVVDRQSRTLGADIKRG